MADFSEASTIEIVEELKQRVLAGEAEGVLISNENDCSLLWDGRRISRSEMGSERVFEVATGQKFRVFDEVHADILNRLNLMDDVEYVDARAVFRALSDKTLELGAKMLSGEYEFDDPADPTSDEGE
ncbi:hypothetical protein R3X27_18880 [Tropicimonas sp. TH_r6]|uniref:hypothetical protein n=1 Tax=Tropicimonas sp. TH_r6 TaxID=3082085 RepID=UPI002952EB6C|nr:hypothetical protein [Tropicimonas sp. TH_r6]MDV7144751.1 hypothetical protein [Tropicimonas sp. TH_r6]